MKGVVYLASEKSASVKKIKAFSEITEKLKEVYPEALCALEWNGEPWRLLVMGRLSAQCTDARVNLVCRDLFKRFPTPKDMAEAELSEIEDMIRSCGLYKTKAQSLKSSCAMLVNEYGGVIPDSMDELLKFPGVGRKIANLLLGDIYKKPGIVADTHCIRICGRLGAYSEDIKDPAKVERIMSKIIVPTEQSDFCHRIVQFGRDFCSARNPKCEVCPIKENCRHFSEHNVHNK